MAHGAVIIFPDHMTKEQCDDILRRMFNAGYCKGVRPDFRSTNEVAPTASRFNPDHGSPVWYIP
jgi:hypothetical protein